VVYHRDKVTIENTDKKLYITYTMVYVQWLIPSTCLVTLT